MPAIGGALTVAGVRRGTSALRIVSLFPSLLGTYGDGGNVLVLAQRARWRGQRVDVVSVSAEDTIPTSGDIYVLGGGEDGSQLAAMSALQGSGREASPLAVAVEQGAQLLAVCAGLQILGEWFLDGSGTQTPGLGLLDLRTSRLGRRAVGELLADPEPSLALPPLSGFENHGGHTVLGSTTRPLATVRRGVGNGPSSGRARASEGAVTDRIIGTYLHGPVLARNPALADLITARALGVAVGELEPLDVAEHEALRRRVNADG
ncbi:MAG: glutamine amidotransferase [Frankiales bacterium]|nr:glutamine amidotransferase [Frankiales bacterium]